MIISEPKSRADLDRSLEGAGRIFLVGCGACATACRSGGEEQVFETQEWLLETGRQVTGSVVIDEACHIPRAGRDLRLHRSGVEEADALLVLACGAGVQSISASTDKRVVGGLNSLFLGNIRRIGSYEEKCLLCGDCILNETAGICPVTTCGKGLLNGPCGGMEEGRCEVDREQDCAWHLIYERLRRQNRQGVFGRLVPPKQWSRRRKPGRHRLGKDRDGDVAPR
ncbi:methylene-tetrahydrofolate reductase-like protein [Geothermobacter ehrlichii]|uniref:Methylene-tetrahydrofolate reductase-like protein n=1 Tax=Geothermobacter ehrlichii TaxID=213224 RepID=A0A5D3WI03_9BACT|nr:methylenetetrahydrofolate reductase C-terminal domain-containing protein [Geothermobacter ehrlichii]TYO96355.1 methylene-tetrahydrofolate reductase-like protein [Geothermobacter ehrlichii]